MAREVKVGSVTVGGNSPLTVQTMYDIPLSQLEENFASRMSVLKAMGCDIIRFSYPDIKDHDALKKVVDLCPMPVVADIHFDYRNALDCIDCNVAALRINPGNIGPRWKTEEIVKKASDRNIAVRIGLNGGSLPENRSEKSCANLMVDTALEYISWFENLGFYNTVVSLKSSDPDVTYEANVRFASLSDYPVHLGVTEAGSAVSSCVRTTYLLSRLLSLGIGNTIRYSITGSIEDEVTAGVELLRTMGLRKGNVRIVSCPMCGRKSFDSQAFLKEVQNDLLATGKKITVAIMGCQVNGPGEAKGADIAVSGIGNSVYLYKNGKIFSKTEYSKAKQALMNLVSEF